MLLPAALRVPDDPTLALANMLLRGLNSKILVYTRQLSNPAVEQHESRASTRSVDPWRTSSADILSNFF